MKKIRLIVGGGLGNQLFQFATYIYLRKKYPQISAELDFFQYRYDAYHNGIEIQHIFQCDCIDEIIKTEQYRKKGKCISNKRYPSLLHTIWCKILGYKTFYDKDSNTPEKMDLVIRRNNKILLAGFYQNPLFVSQITDILHSLVLQNHCLGTCNEELIQSLKNTISVSIHIRRGDYLTLPQYNVFNDLDYYKRAIAHFKNLYREELTFVVFSNDMEWVKRNLRIGNKTIYVDWNKGEDSYKDMILMSHCTHNIIANSSFSWWGAWLNMHPDKVVIAPQLWLQNKPSKNVVPSDWILIEN